MIKTKLLKFKLLPVKGDKLMLSNTHEFEIIDVKKRWFRPTEVTISVKTKLE